MEELKKVKSCRSILLSMTEFAVHQATSTFGVPVFAYLLGISLFKLVSLLGVEYSLRPLHYILTETPYFPVQIALALWFGWQLAKRLRHRSMIYVWLLPFLMLSYAVVAVPTLNGGYTSVLTTEQNRFSHYFGWGCQPKNHCIDQLIVTMPFYAAASYSIGAWLALKTTQIREP